MIRVMFGSVGSDGSEEAASHDRQMDEIVGMFSWEDLFQEVNFDSDSLVPPESVMTY